MPVNPGIYRHLISIRQKTVTGRSAMNEELVNWNNEFTKVWASIEPLRGQEYLEAQRMNASLDTRIRCRWVEGVKASMRVYYNGRWFEIVSPPINVFEGRREMQLMCLEITE